MLKVWSSSAGAPHSHPLYVNVCKTLTISGLSGHGSVNFTVFVKLKVEAKLSGESHITSIQMEILKYMECSFYHFKSVIKLS